MEKTVQSVPFLRLSIALATGIFFAPFFSVSHQIIVVFVVFFLISGLLLNLKFSFRRGSLYGIVIHLFLVTTGILLYQGFNQKPRFCYNGKFLATLLETPQEKQNTYKSLLKIERFSSEGFSSKVNEKVLVYFEKDKQAANLLPGERIIFSTTPQFIKNNGNPFEFDYRQYMERRKIYRQVYLASESWGETQLPNSSSIQVKSELARKRLLDIFKKQKLGENEREILSALTLGYKRELDPETEHVFSAAGAMHVLAVSGLHVGIIYGILLFLFGFLNQKKAGKIIFAVISVLLLWGFAFITGLSPSVMRAATMFSFIITANLIKRQTNIYNTLAASAFILLLINPNNLFEVGFQLSYSAVFGIVFLQPKLVKLLTVRNKILNYFWALLTVSVAAQVSTFPFTIFYFNQFPVYFWISNLFVIPAAIVLIPLATVLLVFSGIPAVSAFISATTNFILSSLYYLLKGIEGLPFSVINISMQKIEFVLIAVLLSVMFTIVVKPKIKRIKIAMIITILLLTVSTFSKIKSRDRKELIVYNNSQNQVIQLISGKMNYVISECQFQENSFGVNQVRQTTVSMNLNDPVFIDKDLFYRNDNIFLKDGIVFFEGKLILLNKNTNQIPSGFNPDFIINPSEKKELNDSSNNAQIIITRTNFYKNSQNNNSIYEVESQGAFRKKW